MIVHLTEKWRVSSSSECWSLDESIVAATGKHAGESRWVARGYYSTLSNALVAAADKLPREDAAELPLAEVVARIEALTKPLRDAAREER